MTVFLTRLQSMTNIHNYVPMIKSVCRLTVLFNCNYVILSEKRAHYVCANCYCNIIVPWHELLHPVAGLSSEILLISGNDQTDLNKLLSHILVRLGFVETTTPW